MAKRKKNKTSMPASGAGLVRYMEDEGLGVKFGPEFILYSVIAIIVLEFLLKAGFI